MFNITKIISHAEETHSNSLESLIHTSAPWYLAVPVFMIVLAMIGYLTWLVSGRNTSKVLIVLAIICLICGFTLYNVSAVVSVIAITLGLLLSVFLIFAGLSSEGSEK